VEAAVMVPLMVLWVVLGFLLVGLQELKQVEVEEEYWLSEIMVQELLLGLVGLVVVAVALVEHQELEAMDVYFSITKKGKINGNICNYGR
jgi:hypothetical protein